MTDYKFTTTDLLNNDSRSWTKLLSMFNYNVGPGFNLFDAVASSGYDNLVVPTRKYNVYYMSMSEVEVNMLTGNTQVIEVNGVGSPIYLINTTKFL